MPGLASSWDESADNLTWTYHLRPGVKWSDGVPLTSADVVYTFNRASTARSSRPTSRRTSTTSHR